MSILDLGIVVCVQQAVHPQAARGQQDLHPEMGIVWVTICALG